MRGSASPLTPSFPRFLHGGDYNPEQWTDDILEEDMRLMRAARCNAMTVGVFAWAALEPREGQFEFGWLDRVLDRLAANGAYAILATPTAAHPVWMSRKYPEVLRVDERGWRRRHGGRLTFCPSSPVFREKCALIVRRLAERYRAHPALLVWHVSNEIRGQCYCETCQAAFRRWLRERYGTLDALNARWLTSFWAHTYSEWDEIEPPRSRAAGEWSIQALSLDWRRFCDWQIAQCVRDEAAILRAVTPGTPVTVNEGNLFANLDVRLFAPIVDALGWDNYPRYHDQDGMWQEAAEVSFRADMFRAAKGGRPFLMMESTPSATMMHGAMKLKRPGIHMLSSLQAVAHGADSVLYFQWRQSRGGTEKIHGGVVAHSGHEHTRVVREVAEVGAALAKLDAVIGTTVRPQVAIVYDRQNDWAIELCQGPREDHKDYRGECERHYRPFWSRGIPVDVIHMEQEFDGYRLIVAPMLYMLLPGVAGRIEAFVRAGGTFVTTFWTGIVDECDLCFQGGFPGPLRACLGVWAEELDALPDRERNVIVAGAGNGVGLAGEYEARHFCELIHPEGADVLASYGREFYAGRPALTRHRLGRGSAFYVASRNDDRFLADFYGGLADELQLRRVIPGGLPEGVTAQLRSDGERDYVFLLNFTRETCQVDLGGEAFVDMLSGESRTGQFALGGYGSLVLARPS